MHINNAAIPCPKTALSARVFRTWMALVGGVVDETNASLVVFGFWFFGFEEVRTRRNKSGCNCIQGAVTQLHEARV